MDAIEIDRALRKAMGISDEPGSCRDCGGRGVVPNTESEDDLNPGWKTCPTCRGARHGGLA